MQSGHAGLSGVCVFNIKFVSKLIVKVELVLNVERFLPDFIRERWIVKTEKIFPNQRSNMLLFNKANYKPIVEKVGKTDEGKIIK